MSEINWDLAPEGADSVKVNPANVLRWFKGNLKYVGGVFADGFDNNDEWKTVAARTKEQEAKQEGEKWTHEYQGQKLRIVAHEEDVNGYIAVMWDTGTYGYCKLKGVNKIKPKLTESAMLSRIAELARGALSDAECGDKIRELFYTVEIT